MNTEVTQYLNRAKLWQDEMKKFRQILLSCKLTEELKWGKPCYTFEGGNVVILQSFKAHLALMFFKGSLLKDPKNILKSQGASSQAAKRIEVTSVADITKLTPTIKSYVRDAIKLEETGQKVAFKKKPEPMPAELKAALAKNARFKKAWDALTPGRQRGYILFFSGAKQSATRLGRIEKCKPMILDGKGMNER